MSKRTSSRPFQLILTKKKEFTSFLVEISDVQRENLQLKKELREAQLERDILKKAVGIFSRGDTKSTNS